MNDKELLELAAKAAGIDVVWRNSSGAFYYDNPDTGREEFDPLTDDGDALRLAVAIGLSVYPMARTETGQACSAAGNNSLGRLSEVTAQSDIAATRRAIVRAAAEIGRMM